MRALKVLVVVMGVLLVGGTAAFVVAVVDRVNHPRAAASAAGRGAAEPTVIDLPPGARVEATDIAGDRLVLRIVLPEGDRQVILVDLRSGARVGTIELRPGRVRGSER